MNAEQRLVKEFHELIGAPVVTRPMIPDIKRMALRYRLIDEEAEEFMIACENEDLVEAADALGDILVVVYGAGLEFGIDLEPVFREIHRSNMTKGGGAVRPDGKALKGPNFEPPQLESIIAHQSARDEWDDYPETWVDSDPNSPTTVTPRWTLSPLPPLSRELAGDFFQRDPGDETR